MRCAAAGPPGGVVGIGDQERSARACRPAAGRRVRGLRGCGRQRRRRRLDRPFLSEDRGARAEHQLPPPVIGCLASLSLQRCDRTGGGPRRRSGAEGRPQAAAALRHHATPATGMPRPQAGAADATSRSRLRDSGPDRGGRMCGCRPDPAVVPGSARQGSPAANLPAARASGHGCCCHCCCCCHRCWPGSWSSRGVDGHAKRAGCRGRAWQSNYNQCRG